MRELTGRCQEVADTLHAAGHFASEALRLGIERNWIGVEGALGEYLNVLHDAEGIGAVDPEWTESVMALSTAVSSLQGERKFHEAIKALNTIEGSTYIKMFVAVVECECPRK